MAKLLGWLGLVIAIAIGIGVFFWRRDSTALESTWDDVRDTTTSWAKGATDELSKAADKIVGGAADGGKKASDVTSDVTDAIRTST
jgi:hypothetical protein